MRFEEGAEWLAQGWVQPYVPVEHDVADEEGAQVGPAAAEEAVCVYGGMRGVPVYGEVFEIGTALDEHFPEAMIAWDGLV